MRFLLRLTLFAVALGFLASCSSSQGGARSHTAAVKNAGDGPNNASSLATRNPFPVIHVFVALCDNVNQGIVPVSASLGNGDNPATNLYWGAAFGVKTFFARSRDWQLVSTVASPQPAVLERLIFKHRQRELYMVADAYRGKEISQAMQGFLKAAAGHPGEPVRLKSTAGASQFYADGSADLVAYVGHNGLMDFELHTQPQARDERGRKAIILACASKQYFEKPLRQTGAAPLLWTTNLMAPEAYVLSAAFDGWMNKESDEEVRARAAKAYHKYQNCGLKAANRLFATGWQ